MLGEYNYFDIAKNEPICSLLNLHNSYRRLFVLVGNAGILIPPDDCREISKQISCIFKNEKVKEELKNKSLSQAKKFTWAKTAEKTLAVYKKLLQK